MTHINPVYAQNGFRLRNDDGSQTSATWIAALNTNASINVDTTFRARFEYLETAGGSGNQSFTLEYNLNGGGWTAVSTTTPIQATTSANVTDATATTQQIGSGTFVAGEISTDAVSANIAFAGNDRTEIEFVLTIDSAQVANNDTIQIRAASITTYTQTPTITVVETSPVWEQAAFRFRNDDGDQSGATWMAALNTNVNVDLDTVFRLRFLIKQTSAATGDTIQSRFEQRVDTGGGFGAWGRIDTAPVSTGDSAFITGSTGDAVQRIGSGTFTDGAFAELNAFGRNLGPSVGNDEMEQEVTLEFPSSAFSNGDVVEFRIYNNTAGAVLDTYTVTPSVTIGSGGITGSLSVQETGSDSASFSGTVAVSGSLTAQETGSDSASFSGTVAVSGSLTAQETGSDSASFSGTVAVSGALSAQETGSDSASFSGTVTDPGITGSLSVQETGSDSASFAGTVAVSGSLTAQETGSDSASFSGAVAVSGSLTAQETGSDSASFSGAVAVSGSLTAQETGSDTASFSGTVTSPGITGTLSVQETGADTFTATAAVSVSGALTATETGSDVFTAAGEVPVSGSLSAVETGTDSFSASGTVTDPDITGTLSVQETGSDLFTATGSVTVSGSLLTQETGSDTAAFSGFVSTGVAVWDQAAFRIRNDDGDKDTATWAAALNTNANIPRDTVFRIRFLFKQNTAVTGDSTQPRLDRRVDTGGGFGAWTTASAELGDSAFLVGSSDDTVQRIGTGTLTEGAFAELNAFGRNLGPSVGNDEMEQEFALVLPTANFSDGDIVEFRAYNNTLGADYDVYSEVPAITVGTGGGGGPVSGTLSVQETGSDTFSGTGFTAGGAAPTSFLAVGSTAGGEWGTPNDGNSTIQTTLAAAKASPMATLNAAIQAASSAMTETTYVVVQSNTEASPYTYDQVYLTNGAGSGLNASNPIKVVAETNLGAKIVGATGQAQNSTIYLLNIADLQFHNFQLEMVAGGGGDDACFKCYMTADGTIEPNRCGIYGCHLFGSGRDIVKCGTAREVTIEGCYLDATNNGFTQSGIDFVSGFDHVVRNVTVRGVIDSTGAFTFKGGSLRIIVDSCDVEITGTGYNSASQIGANGFSRTSALMPFGGETFPWAEQAGSTYTNNRFVTNDSRCLWFRGATDITISGNYLEDDGTGNIAEMSDVTSGLWQDQPTTVPPEYSAYASVADPNVTYQTRFITFGTNWVKTGQSNSILEMNAGTNSITTPGFADNAAQVLTGTVGWGGYDETAIYAEMAGTGSVLGTMSVQETGSDSASFSGTVDVTGSLSVQETGSDTASFTGTVAGGDVTGTLSVQETGPDTASFSGIVTDAGVRVVTMHAQETGADTFSASGTVADPAATGSMHVQETGSDSASFSGTVAVTGSLSAQEIGSDTATFTGSLGNTGTLSVQEAGTDTASITITVLVSGALSAQETGADTFSGIGFTTGINGTLSVQETGSDTASFTGFIGALSGVLSVREAGPDLFSALGTVAWTYPPSATYSIIIKDTVNAEGGSSPLYGVIVTDSVSGKAWVRAIQSRSGDFKPAHKMRHLFPELTQEFVDAASAEAAIRAAFVLLRTGSLT